MKKRVLHSSFTLRGDSSDWLYLPISKGKARTPCEFGVEVLITTTHKEGLVLGARSMPGNPYDGHTLAKALEQAEILSDARRRIAVVDRG